MVVYHRLKTGRFAKPELVRTQAFVNVLMPTALGLRSRVRVTSHAREAGGGRDALPTVPN